MTRACLPVRFKVFAKEDRQKYVILADESATIIRKLYIWCWVLDKIFRGLFYNLAIHFMFDADYEPTAQLLLLQLKISQG